MRAFVTNGPWQLTCVEAPEPERQEGMVLVAFEAGLFTAGTLRAIQGNAAQVERAGSSIR